MCGRQDRHEGFGQHGLEGELRFTGGGLAQQADVDRVVVQSSDLRHGGHLVDVQMHIGVPVPEGAQHAGQHGQGQRGGEADPQTAGPAAADSPGRAQAVGEISEGPPGGGQELTAGRGEGDSSWFTGEQGVADLVLETADLLAQRRLGDAQTGGRVAEVEFFGEHREGVQLRQGKFGALHTPRDIRSCPWLY